MEWSNRYVVIDRSFRILLLEEPSFNILSSIVSIGDLIWPLRPGPWISMDEPTTLIYVAGDLERGERFPQWSLWLYIDDGFLHQRLYSC